MEARPPGDAGSAWHTPSTNTWGLVIPGVETRAPEQMVLAYWVIVTAIVMLRKLKAIARAKTVFIESCTVLVTVKQKSTTTINTGLSLRTVKLQLRQWQRLEQRAQRRTAASNHLLSVHSPSTRVSVGCRGSPTPAPHICGGAQHGRTRHDGCCRMTRNTGVTLTGMRCALRSPDCTVYTVCTVHCVHVQSADSAPQPSAECGDI